MAGFLKTSCEDRYKEISKWDSLEELSGSRMHGIHSSSISFNAASTLFIGRVATDVVAEIVVKYPKRFLGAVAEVVEPFFCPEMHLRSADDCNYDCL